MLKNVSPNGNFPTLPRIGSLLIADRIFYVIGEVFHQSHTFLLPPNMLLLWSVRVFPGMLSKVYIYIYMLALRSTSYSKGTLVCGSPQSTHKWKKSIPRPNVVYPAAQSRSDGER